MTIFQPITFKDGAAYDNMMGVWSQLVGDIFLNWLDPEPNKNWIDIGCGSGAFTEQIIERTSPNKVVGVDPSSAQLGFARSRPATKFAVFEKADAMSLPYDANYFDASTMALVIFFVPDPKLGLAEMVRVTKPGGLVAAYAWDVFGQGLPLEPFQAEFRALGMEYPLPPSVNVSRLEALQELWQEMGLKKIDSRVIEVERTFSSFEEFWTITSNSSVLQQTLENMNADALCDLKTKVNCRLPADSQGQITYSAHANAIKGVVSD